MEGISIQPITLDGRGFDDARVVEEAGPARRTAPAAAAAGFRARRS